MSSVTGNEKRINPSISEISNLLVRWIKAMTDNSALISQNIHNDTHKVHIFCDGIGTQKNCRPCHTSLHFPTGSQDQCRHHKLLNMIIKPFIKGVAIYIPAELHSLHMAQVTQEWLPENFHDHVSPLPFLYMWPHNYFDLNSLVYKVCSVITRKTNQQPCNTKAIIRVMKANKNNLISICRFFW